MSKMLGKAAKSKAEKGYPKEVCVIFHGILALLSCINKFIATLIEN
jgi:hypothetical protein